MTDQPASPVNPVPTPRSRKEIIDEIEAIHLFVRPGQPVPEGDTSVLAKALAYETELQEQNSANFDTIQLIYEFNQALGKLGRLPESVPAPREYTDAIKTAAPKVLAMINVTTKQRLATIGRIAVNSEEVDPQIENMREQNLAARQNLPRLHTLFTELSEALEREQGQSHGMGG